MIPCSRLVLTHFDDARLENRFQAFRKPKAFLFPAIGLLSNANLGYSIITILLKMNYTSAAIRIVVMIISLLLILTDIHFMLLHRKNVLTSIQLAKRQRYLRVGGVWLTQLMDLVQSFEFWNCGSNVSAPPEVSSCLMTFGSRNIVASFLPLWLPINFFDNLIRTVTGIVVEIVIAQLAAGQPVEMRVTRPLYCSCIMVMLLAIQWCLEWEERQHFLAVVRRQELQRKVTQKQMQIAAIVESITEPEQLELLLAGQDTVHERVKCTVMVARFESFVEWRQRFFEPVKAVMVVDFLLKAFELNRFDLGLEKVLVHGDTYISAVGLRTELQPHDPSPLVALGIRMQTVIRKKAAQLFRQLPQLCLGFATGACNFAILHGETLSVIIDGPALHEAVKHTAIVKPELVMVPLPTWNLCCEFDHVVRDSLVVDRVEFIVIHHLQRKRVHVASPISPIAENPGGAPENAITFESGSEASRRNVNAEATSSSAAPPPTDDDLGASSSFVAEIGEFLRWSWPNGDFDALVQAQVQQKERLISAIWLCSTFVEATGILLDDAMTVTSAVLLVVSLIVAGALRFVRLRAQVKVAVFSPVLFALLCAASLMAGRSLANKTFDRFPIIFVLVVVAFGGGLPGIPSALLTFLGWLAIILLFALKGGQHLDFKQLLWQLVLLCGFSILVINRNQKTRSMCRTFILSEKLLSEAEEGRWQHERVLKMLLPSYIVQLASKRQESLATKAIADHLGDAALLSLRLGRCKDFSTLLKTCHWLDELFASLSDVSLIFMDGDTVEAGGPLQRPSQPLGLQPATSRIAGKHVARMHEKAANGASLSLIKAIGALVAKKLRFSAVLHRSDIIAVVRGAKQPSFSVEGRGAEVGVTILRTLVEGQYVATSDFVESVPPTEPAWRANEMAISGAPEKWRFRALGIQWIHVLRSTAMAEPTVA
jgi:hypothetical protein